MLSETADLTEGVNMQTLIKFGSFTPISPRSYAVQRSDLDSEDSGRSETGKMFRNRIRAGVYKIQVTWRVNRSQLSAIANAISPDSFSATFFDRPQQAQRPARCMPATEAQLWYLTPTLPQKHCGI